MFQNDRSPFAVLGIEPTQDHGAVKAAYRRRCMETHPDRGGNADDFRRVRAAWQRLDSIQKTRAAYDDHLPSIGRAATYSRIDYKVEHLDDGFTITNGYGGVIFEMRFTPGGVRMGGASYS